MGLFVWSGPTGGAERRPQGQQDPAKWAAGPFFVCVELAERKGMVQAVDKERLIELLEPAVAALGYELADLDAHFGRRGLLRLYIDRDGGVTVDDCQRVSEQIGAMLDVEDPLPGSYVLEVSSPGFDRRLRTPAHFERFRGEQARIELRDALDGRRNFTGKLAGIEDQEVLIEIDREIWRLPLKEIAVARLAPP